MLYKYIAKLYPSTTQLIPFKIHINQKKQKNVLFFNQKNYICIYLNSNLRKFLTLNYYKV